jgi:chromosome segregation protein
MRLSKIKLAGFKSFVDPTHIDFQSNLTAILGPNGCGKSNTIDAVRWVMGESSAKHLRGQSMEDVIFNGSASRKAIGQASVELVFDNTEKKLGGTYAAFDELSIKRLVRRDGKSQYFLNSTRCRRRDITDIFLGTGLGPRSYAIIEQGMIARLIEAKPAELRVYLEEAAGISKYKQRRREAENRIRHPRESLQRLADVQEEIAKQLARLKRQSKAAIKFKEYKGQERLWQAELLVLRLQQQQNEIRIHYRQLDQQATQHQALLSTLRHTERLLEQQRLEQESSNEKFNQVQGNYYRIGAEISRLEQAIQHHAELQVRQVREQEQIQNERDDVLEQIAEDQTKRAVLIEELEIAEPALEEQSIELEIANERLYEAEYDKNEWQEQWLTLQARLAEPSQAAQIEQQRLLQIEALMQQYRQSLSRLKDEISRYDLNELQQQLTQLAQQQYALSEQKDHLQQQLRASQTSLQQAQIEQKQCVQQREKYQAQQHTAQGRLASLEVLQQAGLGNDNKQRKQWLKKHHLDQLQSLAEQIEIEAGWEKALETVLGQQLESIIIDDIQRLYKPLSQLKNMGLYVLSETKQTTQTIQYNNSVQKYPVLSTKIKQPRAIKTWFMQIYCVEQLEDAFAIQDQLQWGESIITQEGLWLGENWLRVNSSTKQHQGILERQQNILSLQQNIKSVQQQLSHLEQTRTENEQQLQQLSTQHADYQTQFNQCHHELSQVSAAYQSQQKLSETTQQRVQHIEHERLTLQQSLQTEKNNYQQVQKRHQRALHLMQQLAQEKETLAPQQEAFEAAFENASEQVQWLRESVQDSRVQIESLTVQKQLSKQQLQRLNKRLQPLQQRQDALLIQNKNDTVESEASLQDALQTELARQQRSEAQLVEAREQLQSIDQQIKNHETQRLRLEHEISQHRDKIETLKLQWQESKHRETDLLDQLAETEWTQDAISKTLTDKDSIQQHQLNITRIQKTIKNLGAINLAAIEEYEEEAQRQLYLEEQCTDLETALETLETAMAKIDRETRSRFKQTFEQVSRRINVMFPKLFGGGEAYLEMTETNLLEAGVMIMAKPPGKKISNIHLLSGGEKALTAVAMVFAIFELNPAPFCMLDEVDAPLDEANVGRFTSLLKEMSKQVQFIFITHNKLTMELAENLVGVTMREAGVSRLVSVDLEAAVRISDAA